MENNEKTIREQVKEGYDRGVKLAGGREDASQARIVTSPEPLPNELKMYMVETFCKKSVLFS